MQSITLLKYPWECSKHVAPEKLGCEGDFLSLTTLLFFWIFFKLSRHTDLELLIKNPSSPFEQRTYYCLFTWAKQSLWRNGRVGPAGRGFHPLPGSLCELWHLLVKQEPPAEDEANVAKRQCCLDVLLIGPTGTVLSKWVHQPGSIWSPIKIMKFD